MGKGERGIVHRRRLAPPLPTLPRVPDGAFIAAPFDVALPQSYGSRSMALDILGRPASQRRLLVCTGPCCDRLGHASAHLAALRELVLAKGLGESGAGDASCIRRSCLGKCTGDPVAHVQPDNLWYHHLSSENLLRIYEQHVVNRQPVAELVFAEGDG
jgi:(2Fe-2S) ferredoxin